MQRITPCLWFDAVAAEAVEFYVDAFGAANPDGAQVTKEVRYPNEGLLDFQEAMSGQILTLDFTLGDIALTAINAGPEFKPNPSLSFIVNFDPSRDDAARSRLDALWSRLADGGVTLMELAHYPHSERYGWVQDRFGYSWQLMLTDPAGEPRPFLTPSLMFAGDATGKAERALRHYADVFGGSRLGTLARYEQQSGPAAAGSLMYGEASLDGFWLAVMDAGAAMDARFNEALSLMVSCEDQHEIDRLWGMLSRVPEAEQCGWCKDEFGVSWQIVPANLAELMKRPNAFANLMAMHKIVIDDI